MPKWLTSHFSPNSFNKFNKTGALIKESLFSHIQDFLDALFMFFSNISYLFSGEHYIKIHHLCGDGIEQSVKICDGKWLYSWPSFLSNPHTHVKYSRPPDKSASWKIYFLISQPKHMFWVLKRTVSMRRSFLASKTHV